MPNWKFGAVANSGKGNKFNNNESTLMKNPKGRPGNMREK